MAASSQDRDASDGFSPRLATFYAAMFVFAGIVMPFFPVWLQPKGLDSRATGIVLAAPMLMRLVSVPLVARLADRWSASRAALGAASVAPRPLSGASPPREELGVPGRKLLLSPGFWAITAAASLIQASHAVYYGFSVLDWRAKGLDATSIGGLWGLAVVAEIVLFAVSARLPKRLGPLGLVGLGACGAFIRWGAMSFDPPLALLPLLQLLHAFSFGATHLGSIQLLARIAPDRQSATAQGDFATVLALVMAGGMALAGVLYADLGGRAYAAMALAAALGGAFVLLARRFVGE